MSVGHVLWQICCDPFEYLIRRWNWKAAVFSPTFRALIFLFANLSAGWRPALAAALIELLYRGPTAGVYGALTQAFRTAGPPWAAGLTVMVLLPLLSHSVEFLVHLSRRTPNLAVSIVSSMAFTALSTLFNLFAMRRGLLVTGSGASTIACDMKRIPHTLAAFLSAGPIALFKLLRSPGGRPTPASAFEDDE